MQTSGQTDGERIHVAIVEDDDMLREALALGLDEGRYRVTSHGNARAALRAFDEEEVPDVIVLDLMLPEMDGWAFRKAQKPRSRAVGCNTCRSSWCRVCQRARGPSTLRPGSANPSTRKSSKMQCSAY
jgi:CheY-like chemotaxis protein